MDGQNITPNLGPWPSAPWNDPVDYPFMQNGMNLIDAAQVPERTALMAPDGSTGFTPQGPVNDLMALRHRFPYLPIMPFPVDTFGYFLTQNVALDINIPDGAVMMTLRGNADYYITKHGNAAVPTAANSLQSLGDSRNNCFYAPQGFVWYVGGLRTISVVAPVTGTIVSGAFYAAPEMPR